MFGNHYWESTIPVVVISLIDQRGTDTDVNTSVLMILENAGIATKGLAFEPSSSRSSIVIHPLETVHVLELIRNSPEVIQGEYLVNSVESCIAFSLGIPNEDVATMLGVLLAKLQEVFVEPLVVTFTSGATSELTLVVREKHCHQAIQVMLAFQAFANSPG